VSLPNVPFDFVKWRWYLLQILLSPGWKRENCNTMGKHFHNRGELFLADNTVSSGEKLVWVKSNGLEKGGFDRTKCLP
jgi:hypothetical protein